MVSENPILREYAKQIAAILEALGRDTLRFIVQTMRLLAEGRPVSPGQIATALKMPPEEVTSALDNLGVVRDQDGNIVEFSGLSLNPTPHRVRIGGKTLFTWCAEDAIGFPFLFGRTVRIDSTDPVNGTKIRLKIAPTGIEELEPETAVVSWSETSDPTNLRESFCDRVNFFGSPETAAKWVAERDGLSFVSVRDLEEMNRDLAAKFEDLLR